jgi:hypothetical protein
MDTPQSLTANRFSKPYALLCGFVSLQFALLLVYSQTMAFAWDEGFHLLAAQLIKAGRRPYLDFLFSQTPLNAYWNALWMSLFGESWRTAHAVAAVCVSAAVMLVADFAFMRCPIPRWRLPAAIFAAAAFGLNVAVLEFGSVGQAYGLCLLLTVAAFRCSPPAVEKPGFLWPGLAGLFAGGAAAASLLTSAMTPVLFIWLLWNSPMGRKISRALAFAAGVATAFLPLLVLFWKAPSIVIFNVVQYNLFYREVHWAGAAQQNHEVFLAWIDSSHALLLVLLSLTGLTFLRRSSNGDPRLRRDLCLCACTAVALSLHISTASPTFQRYYLLPVPFLSLVAIAGLYWAVARLHTAERPFWPVCAVVFFVALGAGKMLYEGSDDFSWRDFEDISREVARVVPAHSALYADEQVYFLTRHTPPSGLELHDSHKLDFPPERAQALHIVSAKEVERRVRAGEFFAYESCDEERIAQFGLDRIYSQKKTTAQCFVFFNPISQGRAPATR